MKIWINLMWLTLVTCQFQEKNFWKIFTFVDYFQLWCEASKKFGWGFNLQMISNKGLTLGWKILSPNSNINHCARTMWMVQYSSPFFRAEVSVTSLLCFYRAVHWRAWKPRNATITVWHVSIYNQNWKTRDQCVLCCHNKHATVIRETNVNETSIDCLQFFVTIDDFCVHRPDYRVIS